MLFFSGLKGLAFFSSLKGTPVFRPVAYYSPRLKKKVNKNTEKERKIFKSACGK